MELSLNWAIFCLLWTILGIIQHCHIDGLRCYACFCDEVTRLGHTCERSNNREYSVNCNSREDVDKALEYIGLTHKARKHAMGLERISGGVQHEPEEEPTFVFVLVWGDFKEFKLGAGILRSCWQVSKGQVVECGDLKFRDGDEKTFNGCYCARDQNDGQPCNGERRHSVFEEYKLDKQGLSIQVRYKGIHDNDCDENDHDIHRAAKSGGNPSSMTDHLLDAFIIVIVVTSIHIILVAGAIISSGERIPPNV